MGKCCVCETKGPTQVCAGCQSRSYCSKDCQRSDWKEGGHKRQCKEIANLAQQLEQSGIKQSRGSHPLLTKHNTYTGLKVEEMTVPESLDHQEANIRQLLVGYLRTANRESVAFVNFGYSLVDAFAMVQWPEMAARIEGLLSLELNTESDSKSHKPIQEIRFETGCNQMTARITAGYLEGEFCVLKAEMTNTALHKGPKTFSILPGINTTQECLQSTSGKENIVLPFILTACSPKDLIDCISRNPSLRVLNLIGAHESVTDDVLLALVKYCPNLEQLTFGQDNIHLPPLNVSCSTLKTLVSSYKKLKFLRICHPCQEGGDPSDPNGELCHMLNQNGFVQQFIPNPESCRDSLVKHPYQFWRRTVEESYCSAVWYERAVQ